MHATRPHRKAPKARKAPQAPNLRTQCWPSGHAKSTPARNLRNPYPNLPPHRRSCHLHPAAPHCTCTHPTHARSPHSPHSRANTLAITLQRRPHLLIHHQQRYLRYLPSHQYTELLPDLAISCRAVTCLGRLPPRPSAMCHICDPCCKLLPMPLTCPALPRHKPPLFQEVGFCSGGKLSTGGEHNGSQGMGASMEQDALCRRARGKAQTKNAFGFVLGCCWLLAELLFVGRFTHEVYQTRP